MQFPRFILERSYSLKDALQTLDITQVFQDNADLSNMGGAEGSKLKQVSVCHIKSCLDMRHLHLEGGCDVIKGQSSE